MDEAVENALPLRPFSDFKNARLQKVQKRLSIERPKYATQILENNLGSNYAHQWWEQILTFGFAKNTHLKACIARKSIRGKFWAN